MSDKHYISEQWPVYDCMGRKLNSVNRFPTMGRWESFGWANVLEESGLPYVA